MLYESSRIKTFAEGLLEKKSVDPPNENIGFARAMLSRAIAIHRINNKNLRFGIERLADRFFDCNNKCTAEKS